MKRVRWFFNPLMLAGAVLSSFLWGGLDRIEEAVHQQGAGWVSRGDDDPEMVSESQFKRERLGDGAAMLFGALLAWAGVAWEARRRAQELDKERPRGVRCGDRVYTAEEWAEAMRRLDEFHDGGKAPPPTP